MWCGTWPIAHKLPVLRTPLGLLKAAVSNNAVARDLRIYFTAVPSEPVDTSDLYS